jgi:hypothetical protein
VAGEQTTQIQVVGRLQGDCVRTEGTLEGNIGALNHFLPASSRHVQVGQPRENKTARKLEQLENYRAGCLNVTGGSMGDVYATT